MKMLFAAGCLYLSTSLAFATSGAALPAPMAQLGPPAASAPIIEARLFCYNRYTGRFKHWGACHRVAAPRVYCRSRVTGEFLHWGACGW